MRRIFRWIPAFFAAFVMLTSASAAAERRVALVIGNSAYEHAGPLRNPVNDAADISSTLKRLNFQVTTILDADGATLADALAAFANTAQGADTALFWYAGHGIQFNNANYFLPIDARLDNEFAVRRETFAFEDIIRRMESAAKISLIFIDACRNTPLADKLKARLATSSRSASVGRGLARVQNQAPDTLIVYATAPGEIAQDGAGRNSPFAEAMLRHMETPGVDVEVMLKDVTSDVRRATREQQRPERLSRLESKFMFRPAATEPARQATADLDAAADENRSQARRAEQLEQEAEQQAAEAARRRREADAEAQAAEERKRAADEENRRRKDQARLEIAEREALEAEERRRKAIAEAEAAEARWRKAEAEAKAAELRARQAEQAAGRRQSASLDEQAGARDENRRDVWRRDQEGNDPGRRDWAVRETDRRPRPDDREPAEADGGFLWDHNGSTISLEAASDGRRFRYKTPRRGMVRSGVRPGTVLFEGIATNGAWVGTAYVFSRRCGPLAYVVEGNASDAGRRVTLRGRAPKVDESCRIIGHLDDTLVFDRLSTRE